MNGVVERVKKLEKGQVKLEEKHAKHDEILHKHDISIKLHERDVQSVLKEMSQLGSSLQALNTTVVTDVVPMMSGMAASKATKEKFEAKVGKIILGIISLVAVTVSVIMAFFKP